MGRPRRPLNGVEKIYAIKPDWIEAGQPGVRQQRRWAAAGHWTYRQVNGLYDPLTYFFVLQTLGEIDPMIELRAKNLAEYLNHFRDQFIWDAITVGRVLAELYDAFENKFGKKNGLLEKGKDYKGVFYLMRHSPQIAKVYIALLDDLLRESEMEINARALGQRTERMLSPLLECPSIRVEWVDDMVS